MGKHFLYKNKLLFCYNSFSDSCDENSSQSDDFNDNNNTLDKLDNINETLPWYESSDYDNDNEKQDNKTDVSDEYENSEQLSTDESESSDQLISTDEDDIETEKNNTESVDNEIDEDAERTKQGLLEWMDWVAKKLDFVHNFELEEEEEIEEGKNFYIILNLNTRANFFGIFYTSLCLYSLC